MGPRLSLFGVIHVDRPSKVAAELDAYVERADADALFVEWPTGDDLSRRDLGHALARAPAALLGAIVYGLLSLLLYLPTTRRYATSEQVAVERVAAERGLSVHRVDRHLVSLLAETGSVGVAVNWLALLAVAWFAPVAVARTAALLLGVGVVVSVVGRYGRRVAGVLGALAAVGVGVLLWTTTLLSSSLLAVTALAMAGFVFRTLGKRNDEMLAAVADGCRAHGYDSVVLVTGKAHAPGMLARAADHGLDVARVHASRFFRHSDDTVEDPVPGQDLPGVPELDGGWPPTRDGSERAALWRRATAAFVDLAFAAAFAFLVAVLVVGTAGEFVDGPAVTVAGVAAGALAALAYFLLFELLVGRTTGKRLFGVAVVDEAGERPSRRALVVRNVLRPLDVLAFPVALLDDRGQRLGDRAAGTVVRRTVSATDTDADGDDEPLAATGDRPSRAADADEEGLAPLSRRAGAAAVDAVVLAPLVGAGVFVGTVLVGDARWLAGLDLVVGFLVVPVAYHAVLEAAFARTAGKAVVGVEVTDGDGGTPATWRVLVRNAIRPVDAVGAYLVGFLVASLTDRYRRLGDVAAGTEVRER